METLHLGHASRIRDKRVTYFKHILFSCTQAVPYIIRSRAIKTCLFVVKPFRICRVCSFDLNIFNGDRLRAISGRCSRVADVGVRTWRSRRPPRRVYVRKFSRNETAVVAVERLKIPDLPRLFGNDRCLGLEGQLVEIKS